MLLFLIRVALHLFTAPAVLLLFEQGLKEEKEAIALGFQEAFAPLEKAGAVVAAGQDSIGGRRLANLVKRSLTIGLVTLVTSKVLCGKMKRNIPFVNRRQLMLLPAWADNALGAAFFRVCRKNTPHGLHGEPFLPDQDPTVQSIRSIFKRVTGAAAKADREAAGSGEVRVAVCNCPAGSSESGSVERDWELVVVNGAHGAAYSTFGGKVVIFNDFLKKLMPDDDMIASVLSHEVAHSIAFHSAESLQGSIPIIALGLAIAPVASMLVRGVFKRVLQKWTPSANPDDLDDLCWSAESAGLLKTLSWSMSNCVLGLMLRLPRSRQMEFEADAIGLNILIRAGYSPTAAPKFFRAFPRTPLDWMSNVLGTHPDNESRAARLELLMPLVIARVEEEQKNDMNNIRSLHEILM